MTTKRMSLFNCNNKPSLLDKQSLDKIFDVLNSRLSENKLYLELYIYGGTVMNLLYDCRPATRDIDCVFNNFNEKLLDNILDEIRQMFNLGSDWINQEVAIPLKSIKRENMKEFTNYTNLKIMIPSKEQLLAMKVLAARPEPAKDFIDAGLLCKDLGITEKEEVLNIFYMYFNETLYGARQQMFVRYLGEDLGYDWK